MKTLRLRYVRVRSDNSPFPDKLSYAALWFAQACASNTDSCYSYALWA